MLKWAMVPEEEKEARDSIDEQLRGYIWEQENDAPFIVSYTPSADEIYQPRYD